MSLEKKTGNTLSYNGNNINNNFLHGNNTKNFTK